AGAELFTGHFVVGNGEFRHPRDVAVSSDGRLFVADTYNHRVVVLKADGSHYRNLGAAPLLGGIQKIEVDNENHVFVIDSDNNRLVAYLGPVDSPPFDAYIRDFVGDSGVQPSATGFALSSPDILIRHNPDVNLSVATTTGLGAFAFQQPRFGMNNYVYLAVRNRGTHAITGVTAKLYWSPGSPLVFPEGWQTDGFYSNFVSATANSPTNSMFMPYIEPRHTVGATEVDGAVVVGPIIWRPPPPESAAAADGVFHFLI